MSVGMVGVLVCVCVCARARYVSLLFSWFCWVGVDGRGAAVVVREGGFGDF